MAYSIEQLKSIVSNEGGIAKQNLFAVQLPPIPDNEYSADVLNLLTTSVTLPPRQLNTVERNINGYRSKVGNGSLTDDIAMSFLVTNSMLVKEYFEAWMNLVWNTETRRSGYFRDYAKTVQIKVLRLPRFDTDFRIKELDKIPFRSKLPDVKIGPIDISLGANKFSFDIGQHTQQTITLENAYPFTLNPIEMSDGNTEFMNLQVSFTYSEWYAKAGLGNVLAGAVDL